MQSLPLLCLTFLLLLSLSASGQAYLNASTVPGRGRIFSEAQLLNVTPCKRDEDCQRTEFGEFSICKVEELGIGTCHCIRGPLFNYEFRSHLRPYGCVLDEGQVTKMLSLLSIAYSLPYLAIVLVIICKGLCRLMGIFICPLGITWRGRPLGWARKYGQYEAAYIDLEEVVTWRNGSGNTTSTEGMFFLFFYVRKFNS